jgi:methionine sulfoxide reductase heme-binding subunit
VATSTRRASVARGRRPDPAPAPTWRQRHAAGLRHVVLALVTAALTWVFWRSRMQWTPDMRLWRAVGDAAVVLLFASLALGPAGRLWRPAAAALPWRRAVGVWAATASLAHGALVFWGWVQLDVGRLMGYEFVPQLGRAARMEPGFGLANLMGLVALVWLAVMAVTSSDAAIRRLGPGAWKWVHTSAYVVFYLAALHSAYFLFMHYTLSFHKAVPEPNWFRWPLVVLALTVLALQLAAVQATRLRRPGGRPATA